MLFVEKTGIIVFYFYYHPKPLMLNFKRKCRNKSVFFQIEVTSSETNSHSQYIYN